MHFALLHYTHSITDISLIICINKYFVTNFYIENYANFTKQEPKISEFFFSINMHILHARVAGLSNISWRLHTYCSVTVHFWIRHNIEAFPLAQHLKFCYHSEHIQQEPVPLCVRLINNSDVAVWQAVIIRYNVKTKQWFQEIAW